MVGATILIEEKVQFRLEIEYFYDDVTLTFITKKNIARSLMLTTSTKKKNYVSRTNVLSQRG